MTMERTYTLPSSTTLARLFDVPYAKSPSPGATHWEEWLKQELFTKVGNTVTNRSNVFAVYLTVGFFEVVPEFDSAGNAIRPEKLGEEIGPALLGRTTSAEEARRDRVQDLDHGLERQPDDGTEERLRRTVSEYLERALETLGHRPDVGGIERDAPEQAGVVRHGRSDRAEEFPQVIQAMLLDPLGRPPL